jgi:probable HAF family extracellular repeat protein
VKNVKRNWLATVAGLLFLVSAIPERAAAQVSYTITDLGTLGGDNSIPYWITNTGEVVGVSDTGQFDAFGNPVDHAFRWVGGPLQDLQTLGGNDSSANGANAEGQAVGIADVTGGSTSHAVLWQGGTIADLGALNGPSGFSFAQLVNGSRQVIGASTTADGTFRGFVWDRGVMTELGTLGGANSFALGINDRGQVVGISQVNDIVDPILGFPDFHGTLWDHGEMVNLTPGAGADAFNINNKSQVVGRLLIPDSIEGGVARAYVWQEGVLTDLGVPAGDDNSQANSINDNGQIVGAAGVGFIETYAPDRALLWQNGRLFDLNTLIPGDSGYHLIVAFDINARGQIVVCAVQLSTGNIHAAILTPQPSNVSGAPVAPRTEAAVPALSESAKRLLRFAMAKRNKH